MTATLPLAHRRARRAGGPTTPPTLDQQLEPVRRALLEDAATEAERIVATATDAADRLVAEAQRAVDTAVEAARRRAAAASRARAETARVRSRREQHAALLRAEARHREEVRNRIVDAVRTIRGDPRYPDLLDRLEELARAQLGADAVVDRDPAPDGGVLATSRGRRVDYRLDALAERAAAAIEVEVAASWR